MAKAKTYYIGTKDGAIPIKGHSLKIDGFPNLIVHKALEGSSLDQCEKHHGCCGWKVSETTTGFIVTGGPTRREAAINARVKLQKHGREKFLEIVARTRKIGRSCTFGSKGPRSNQIMRTLQSLALTSALDQYLSKWDYKHPEGALKALEDGIELETTLIWQPFENYSGPGLAEMLVCARDTRLDEFKAAIELVKEKSPTLIDLIRKHGTSASMGDNDQFNTEMAQEHRTHQQSFTRLCVKWLEFVGQPEYLTDGRNECSAAVGQQFNEAVKLDRIDPYLPFV